MENNSSEQVRVIPTINRGSHSTKLSEQKKQNLKSAWIEVTEGRMTAYKAAKIYNVSLSTLTKWCKRDDIVEVIPSVGRPCFLGTNLEMKLKEWILEAARTCKALLHL